MTVDNIWMNIPHVYAFRTDTNRYKDIFLFFFFFTSGIGLHLTIHGVWPDSGHCWHIYKNIKTRRMGVNDLGENSCTRGEFSFNP